MNTVYNVGLFVDKDTTVVVPTGDPLVMRIIVDETNIDFYVATTNPSAEELESGVAFLDNLILNAVDIRRTMLRQIAAKDEPTKLRIER